MSCTSKPKSDRESYDFDPTNLGKSKQKKQSERESYLFSPERKDRSLSSFPLLIFLSLLSYINAALITLSPLIHGPHHPWFLDPFSNPTNQTVLSKHVHYDASGCRVK